jgi:predicted nucleic acid-binding protein
LTTIPTSPGTGSRPQLASTLREGREKRKYSPQLGSHLGNPCLNDFGRAIPYKRLCSSIGRESDNSINRHVLRQYIGWLREILLTNKSPYVIAVVHDVGCVLCEIAENPRHTSRTRRRKDVAQLARNVRQLRLAVGLTQTALAKRSGIRAHRLAFWDAMLWASAHRAGVRHLLTEDLQDGFALQRVTFINPFKREHDLLID